MWARANATIHGQSQWRSVFAVRGIGNRVSARLEHGSGRVAVGPRAWCCPADLLRWGEQGLAAHLRPLEDSCKAAMMRARARAWESRGGGGVDWVGVATGFATAWANADGMLRAARWRQMARLPHYRGCPGGSRGAGSRWRTFSRSARGHQLCLSGGTCRGGQPEVQSSSTERVDGLSLIARWPRHRVEAPQEAGKIEIDRSAGLRGPRGDATSADASDSGAAQDQGSGDKCGPRLVDA